MARMFLGLILTLCLGAYTAAADDPGKAKPCGAKKSPGNEKPAVDKCRNDPQRRVRMVMRLANSPAEDVAAAVNEFLAGERRERQADPRYDSSRAAGSDPVIVPDPLTNSLILSGTPQDLDAIKEIVAQLDRQPASVAIEVLIAELTLDRPDRPGGKNRPHAPKDHAKRQPGLAELVLKDAGADVESLSEALKKYPGLKVLSRPRIIVLDNQPAFIQVGRRVPVVSTTETEERSVVATDYVNVGLTLGVTARIGPDGSVVMEIDVERSRLGPVEEGIPVAVSPDGKVLRSPQIQVISAHTTVSVPDGKTVLLGGLTVESGPNRTELLIAVTPRIIRTKGRK